MPGARSMRLVDSALRCYPQRWRSRHGDEAAEIASLLILDGTPARSVAWSYFMGAARTRLVVEPRRRLGVTLGALLLAVCSLGVPLALLSSATANAASVAHSHAAHSRTVHPHGARPRTADPRHDGARPTGARHGARRGGPDRGPA
jgi:hypothetical protein